MRALPALVLLIGAVSAHARVWTVDPAQSDIRFGSEWNGQKIEGRFAKWSAAIRFDPADLTSASVTVTVDLASASTGDRTVNASLPGEDWFAVKTTPTARFTSTSISATGPNRYLARGLLELRGRKVPVELPFTLGIAGDVATMTGATQLDRRSFGIGMDSDAQGTWVAFPVPVRVRVVARRTG
ncbi:YceI family protein [Thermaurantiacus sp.]